MGRPKGSKNKKLVNKVRVSKRRVGAKQIQTQLFDEIYKLINELHNSTQNKEDQYNLGFRQALKEIGYKIYLIKK